MIEVTLHLPSGIVGRVEAIAQAAGVPAAHVVQVLLVLHMGIPAPEPKPEADEVPEAKGGGR